MASLIHDLQRGILQNSKSLVELLRTAKVVSVKLGLDDVSAWINAELEGYRNSGHVPEYRKITGAVLQAHNPYHGWLQGHPVKEVFPVMQPISQVEHLAKLDSVQVLLTEDQKYGMRDTIGRDITYWQQRLVMDSLQMQGIVNAVKEKLLDWALELEKRGITGEGMSFDADEKRLAHSANFHIQNFTGIIGDVSNSSVQVYDYSSVHQSLKDHNVPQSERNALENLMDELKQAEPSKKTKLMDNAKEWLVRNEKVLGAAGSIVRRTLGLEP